MHDELKDGELETHVSRDESRAGSSTKINRNVLGISLPLVIVALGIAVAVGFWMTDHSGADDINANNGVVASGENATAD